jgi:hypothetical protein
MRGSRERRASLTRCPRPSPSCDGASRARLETPRGKARKLGDRLGYKTNNGPSPDEIFVRRDAYAGSRRFGGFACSRADSSLRASSRRCPPRAVDKQPGADELALGEL